MSYEEFLAWADEDTHADDTRQHFRIPVTTSDGVIDLMNRTVASD
ncbi:MAG: hypothetical protein BroJett015_22660 [Chloroflexota bacterium]|nr:MAG: hypothetical protein BroJett015_22660 [Chloroflexota bacterium]